MLFRRRMRDRSTTKYDFSGYCLEDLNAIDMVVLHVYYKCNWFGYEDYYFSFFLFLHLEIYTIHAKFQSNPLSFFFFSSYLVLILFIFIFYILE